MALSWQLEGLAHECITYAFDLIFKVAALLEDENVDNAMFFTTVKVLDLEMVRVEVAQHFTARRSEYELLKLTELM